MAIPFLNHLDLRSVSELQNAILHKTTASSASNVEGKIIYDTGSNTVKYYNGGSWVSVSGNAGDITAVNTSSSSGLSGGTTSGAANLQVNVDNSTIRITSNKLAAKTAAIANGGSGLATADQIHTFVTTQTDTIAADTTGNAATATNVAYSGLTGTVPTWNQNTTGTAANVTGTVAIANGGTGATTASQARTNLGVINDTGTPAILSNGSAPSLNSGISAAEVRSLIGAGTGNGNGDITAVNTPASGGLSGGASSGSVSLSLKNSGSLTQNNIVKWDNTNNQLAPSKITDDGTTVFINGNLDVAGTTTTIDSTTVAIGDNMMEYAKDNTSNVSDIGWFGKIVSSGTKYPTMYYDASSGVSTPTFMVGLATTKPGSTAAIVTKGTVNANLVGNVTGNVSGSSGSCTGNAATATKLQNARNFSITGDITASNVSFNGTGNVSLNANIDANVVGASELKVSSNGTAGQVLASDGDGTFSWTSKTAAANNATVSITTSNGLTGATSFTLNQSSNKTIALSVANAGNGSKGVVALASKADVQGGTQTTEVITPDTLASKSVVSTIVAASVSSTSLFAEIAHNLGTEDVIVQCFDATTKETVFAEIERKDKAGNNSTSKITVRFSGVPSNNVEVLVTSIKGATSASPSYS